MRLSFCILLLTAAAAVLAPRDARGQRLFVGAETIPLESPASAIEVEDLDGDGRPDAVALHGSRNSLSVLLSRGDGRFGEPRLHETGRSPVAMQAGGDFDANGGNDILVVNSGSASVSLLLNRGDGSFSDARSFAVGPNPRTVGIADFDSDGSLDAVTSDLISVERGQLTLLLGDGRGGFAAGPSLDIGDNAHSLVIEDVDGNGSGDIAVAHTHTLSFFRSRGDGTFDREAVDLPGLNPRVLASGDLTGEGRPDVATHVDQGSLIVLVNGGVAGFQPRIVTFDRNFGAPYLGAGDFDGDGVEDLVTLADGRSGDSIRVHRGSLDGFFPMVAEVFLGFGAVAVAIEDLDGDAAVDALSPRSSVAELALLRGDGRGGLESPWLVPLESEPRDIAPFAPGPGLPMQVVAASSSAIHFIESTTVAPAVARIENMPGRALQAVEAGDFDGDGLQGLAVADLVSGSVVLLERPGEGVKPLERKVHDSPHRLLAADLDRDGIDDLVVLDQVGDAVSVLLRPDTVGAPEPMDLVAGAGQTAVDADDLDGDGKVDLAVAVREGVSVFLGDGAGRFVFRRGYPLRGATDLQVLRGGPGPVELAVVAGRRLAVLRDPAGEAEPRIDELELPAAGRTLHARHLATGSGHDLIASMTDGIGVVRLLPQGIEPRFGPIDTVPLGSQVRGAALVDLDGDGLPDLAVADFAGSSVSVLRGAARDETGSFRRGDADANGVVSLTDAVVVLERLFRGGAALPCEDAADTNDDGALDITDPIGLLGHLFLGGPPPPAPGREACGEDGTADALEECRGECR